MASTSGSVREGIAPLSPHVKTLSMPNVCLQPNVFLATTVVLLKKVGWSTSVLPAWTTTLLYVVSALNGGGSGVNEDRGKGKVGGRHHDVCCINTNISPWALCLVGTIL